MNSDTLRNPYLISGIDPSEPTVFVGRKAAMNQVYQQLRDPAPHAVVFTGRQSAGKSALLQHLNHAFDETFVGVYIPLAETQIDDEGDWLLTLAQHITAEIVQRGFTISRLVDLEPPGEDVRAWFQNTFLRELLGAVRPHRRLFLLLDDAEHLLNAVTGKRLPEDSFTFLQTLLQRQPQMGIVLTLDDAFEGDLSWASPLVRITSIYRLANLSSEDTARLLTEPVATLYSVEEAAIEAVYRATGGAPKLVSSYGSSLFERWYRTPDQTMMTTDDVKAVTPAVYSIATPEYRAQWADLPLSERLVLTALGSLIFNDAQRSYDSHAISAWLVETDYPMDATAINASLRSLEYGEILTLSTAGVAFNAGLMQTWVIENARLGEGSDKPMPPPQALSRTLVLWVLVVALAVILVVLVVVNTRSDTDGGPNPAPTVTLANEDE